jgi:hypothetical protein
LADAGYWPNSEAADGRCGFPHMAVNGNIPINNDDCAAALSAPA